MFYKTTRKELKSILNNFCKWELTRFFLDLFISREEFLDHIFTTFDNERLTKALNQQGILFTVVDCK
jgi:hypothetical protein